MSDPRPSSPAVIEPASGNAPASAPPRRSPLVPIVLIGLLAAALALGVVLLVRAESRTNRVSLSQAPKPVTVVEARASTFRAMRTFIGTVEPWVEAKIGPQLVSAYVDTVLVRPGAVVKRNEVLATLDCKSTSAASQAVAAQARAVDARLKALNDESARYTGLLDAGFMATNEAEQKAAQAHAQEAELGSAKAKLAGTALEVSDCILRAPFDGEIATRTIDPGAFVRPGMPIVSIVDRQRVRVSADPPEVDFGTVAPGTVVRVRLLATGADVPGVISRRAPSADPGTRTIHVEIDLPDPDRRIPVGTTAEILITVGEPVAATEIPLSAAQIRNEKAVVYVLDGDVARSQTLAVRGEMGGTLFVDPVLPAGARLVSEGRALLSDGDRVTARLAAPAGSAK